MCFHIMVPFQAQDILLLPFLSCILLTTTLTSLLATERASSFFRMIVVVTWHINIYVIDQKLMCPVYACLRGDSYRKSHLAGTRFKVLTFTGYHGKSLALCTVPHRKNATSVSSGCVLLMFLNCVFNMVCILECSVRFYVVSCCC